MQRFETSNFCYVFKRWSPCADQAKMNVQKNVPVCDLNDWLFGYKIIIIKKQFTRSCLLAFLFCTCNEKYKEGQGSSGIKPGKGCQEEQKGLLQMHE